MLRRIRSHLLISGFLLLIIAFYRKIAIYIMIKIIKFKLIKFKLIKFYVRIILLVSQEGGRKRKEAFNNPSNKNLLASDFLSLSLSLSFSLYRSLSF